MRSSSAISLGIAIVFGALAAFLARSLLQGGDMRVVQPAPSMRVVVATTPLAFGVPLSAENLRETDWPPSAALEGSFTSIEDLLKDGRRLTLTALQRNEPVLAAKITAPNQRATLSTQIDEGMRAVTVRVDEVRGVAGFVLPGDRVDVILTRGEGGSQEAAAYADILLQNAKVLAVDQLANERQDKPAVARAVTLELSVEEAQKVILAQGVGRLSLILRQAGEPDGKPARRVTAGDLGSEASATKDRVAELEARIEELKKAAEQASARAGDGARQQLAEMEMRLRGELSRQNLTTLPGASPAPPPPGLTINVIRNGSKREPYSVGAEN